MKLSFANRRRVPWEILALATITTLQGAIEDDEAAQTLPVGNSDYTTPSPFNWNLDEDSTSIGDFDRAINGKKLTLTGTLVVILGPNVDLSTAFWDTDKSWLVFSGFNTGSGNNGSNFSTITPPTELATARPGASFTATPSVNGNWSLDYNSASFVPEPTSAIVGGLIGLGFLRRRRG